MSTEESTGPSGLRAWEPGRVIGEKYRILRRLGQGGMGTVYEACHTSIERRVAIKFLRPELVDRADMVARFHREALAAGRIQHENVVTITDVGTLPTGLPYLVMELLAGETLTRVLEREGAFTVGRATSLIVQACRGVAAAHVLGVVHRDLKPDNLFLCQRADGSEQLKVLDFGIAKLETGSVEDGLVTKTGATLGTPHYMSPEQARGQRTIDARTDVYSLGAVLYELLAGIRPHSGTSYNEIIYHILTKQPPPLERHRPDLPAGLAESVTRAMARETSERYADAVELMDALLPYTASGGRTGSVEASARATSDPAAATVRLPDGPAWPTESLAAASRSRPPASLRPTTFRMERVVPWVVAAMAVLGGTGLVLARVARVFDLTPAVPLAASPTESAHSSNAPPAPEVRAVAPLPPAASSPRTEPDRVPEGNPPASVFPSPRRQSIVAPPPSLSSEPRAARMAPPADVGRGPSTTSRTQGSPSQIQPQRGGHSGSRERRVPPPAAKMYDSNNPYR